MHDEPITHALLSSRPRPGARRVQVQTYPQAGTGAADYSDLKAGQRVRVTLEGTVEVLTELSVPADARKRLRLASGVTVSAAALKRADALVITGAPASPWKAGDVVVVNYGGPLSRTSYTYVRLTDGTWSGALTDAEADRHIDSGRAVWAMRDGLPVAKGPNVPKRPEPFSLPF